MAKKNGLGRTDECSPKIGCGLFGFLGGFNFLSNFHVVVETCFGLIVQKREEEADMLRFIGGAALLATTVRSLFQL